MWNQQYIKQRQKGRFKLSLESASFHIEFESWDFYTLVQINSNGLVILLKNRGNMHHKLINMIQLQMNTSPDQLF